MELALARRLQRDGHDAVHARAAAARATLELAQALRRDAPSAAVRQRLHAAAAFSAVSASGAQPRRWWPPHIGALRNCNYVFAELQQNNAPHLDGARE